ncbi:MAG TPA: type II secretion system F family protein [Peptococcaceae bacterium]|jgi:tight adherence protein C|nr:type II secretion system F family protein [Peptococcaceae bacterium]
MMKVVLCSFLFFTTLALAFFQNKLRGKKLFLSRLQNIARSRNMQDELVDDELSKPFFERIISPFLEWVSQAIARHLPTKNRDKLQQMLQLAGYPGNLHVHEFQALQLGVIILFMLGFWLLAYLRHQGAVGQLFQLLIGAIMGILFMRYYLTVRIRKRQETIEKELPAMLDLLSVSVEAGLGFDAALERVVSKAEGELSDELRRTFKDIQRGKSRRQALKDLAERTGVEDVHSFVGAIIQAEQLGVSIGKVVHTQAEQARQKRRQRVEEKAMKAPVKMLIPLVLFIFPTIFIVLLGPALINLMEFL